VILLLAGTAEARELAAALAARGVAVIASLAGAVRDPLPLGVPTRIGGFGGDAGFGRWLDDNPVRAVIDATHPFAARISARTTFVCAARGLPLLRLKRPGWSAGPGDNWTWIGAEAEAADHVPPHASVFLATGRQTLERFAGMTGRRLYLRVIDRPLQPFPFDGDWIVARPPFTPEAERALFQKLRVDVLVAKDSGGAEGRAKLDAARSLGLPVLMIRRPTPVGPVVADVQAARDWVAAL